MDGCGILSFDILGPYFFRGINVIVTVIYECYVEIVNNYLHSELQRLRVYDCELWFWQPLTRRRYEPYHVYFNVCSQENVSESCDFAQ